MTKLFVAIVKDKYEKDASPFIMKEKCKTKKEFLSYASGNGYTVNYNEVFTEEEWNLLTEENQAVTMRQYKIAYDYGYRTDWYESNNKEKIERAEKRRDESIIELLA